MANSKKRKSKQPKKLETLPDKDLMRHIFGPEGHQHLKREAKTHDAKPKNDYRFPTKES